MIQVSRIHIHSLSHLVLLVLTAMVFSSCVDEDEFDDTANGNFEALWKIMDEHYCFFQEKGIDWNAIHEKYQKQVAAEMSNDHLFEVCANMLSELKDGHVNLFSSFDIARNWSWHENYPSNYSDSLINKYLGTDYKIAAAIRYKILDDNIGYMRYGSFQSDFGAGNIDQVLLEFAPCQALIIDIRDNSGGLLTVAEKLAARFTNEEILVGYMRHKNGKGHQDFSEMKEQRIKPSNGVRWHKPVYVLTNRQVYSAANEFVKYMRCCHAVIVGDQTGGGAGMPFSSELPNGWSVRFSACPMYDVNKQSTEQGIAPDYRVDLTHEDFTRGRDSIIEFARSLVH
ncbi:MAG: S41 family peptidase [Prevotella sp.]|nr:S41 family peptidase [Prevotella sp.]